MSQIILPVKYRTRKIYYQKQNSPKVQCNTYDFSSFQIDEQQLLEKSLADNADYQWILYCYQDPLDNEIYALVQQCKPTVLYKKLPNEWLLKILSC